MEKSDYELIKAVGAGDHRAFEHLVRKYQDSLLNFVSRYLNDRDAAEDIVQEVFLALYRNAARFEARARASTWLFRIAYNLSMNEIKRGQRNVKFKGTLRHLLPLDSGPYAVDGVAATERQKDVIAALDLLPEKQRAAMLLRVNEELSYGEISEVLSVSVAAVESLIFRARARLRKLLQKK